MHWLAIIAIAIVVTACASIGRPEGGPRDTEPPVFVYSNPETGAKNIDRQRLDIYFNENVQLEDAFNKVIVSPAQKNNAKVSANGKHVIVELQDSLRPNTTYTIDFADAIKDLNEGNILDGFTTYFSTGDTIDTLRISGIVLEARTLEPAQGMLVGAYSNLSDTAIHTLPLERIARTNQLGQFTIHNLKPGTYNIFALNDLNHDFKWDRSEDIAFYDVQVSPYVTPITVTDTLRSSTNTDSLVERAGHAYFPNDVLLTWFNENYKPQYLKDYKRLNRRTFQLKMAAPADSLPQITIAAGPYEGKDVAEWTILGKTPQLDSLTYWITDPDILAVDSLYLSVKYQRTDTNDLITWKTDTLKFFYKEPKTNKKKKKEETESDTIKPEIKYMDFRMKTSNTVDVHRPLIFVADQPIDSIDPNGVHLQLKKDTVWIDQANVKFVPDSLDSLLTRMIYYKWAPGEKYRITIDSAAVRGVYDERIKELSQEFSVKNLEEYANLNFKISGVDTSAIVELLDKGDKVIATAPVVKGTAKFPYMNPGTVYARLYIDKNNNGVWDTGSLLDSIQPEEVYYFPKKINLKKNWDISQEWNIYETAYDMQKPYEIKKNKPKLKKGEKAPQQNDEEDEEDDGVFGDNNAYSNARRNNNRNNLGGMGGMIPR